ncbi:MAG: hypothetical protein WAQ05_21200 [Rubrivivax sp.]
MSFTQMIAPTSKSIQKEYVDKRLRGIRREDKAKAGDVADKIVAMQRQHGIGTTLRPVPWTDTYLAIYERLQSADLTINLDAGSWFIRDNTYASYSQMYERATGANGQLALKDDEYNKAAVRAVADDLVTLPDEWANAHPFSQRKRLYKAMNVTGATTTAAGANMAGLKPQHHPKLVGNGKTGFATTNTHFKAKAREVFAALNYGRRMHGSNTTYGFSHLVLNPELKKRAIYYPSDTFFLASKGVSSQCSYETIGSLIKDAHPDLLRDIWDSCHQRRVLSDTSKGALMVEAHIFQKLKIAEHVQALVLSRKRSSTKPAFAENEWRDIINNAKAWCNRNAVRLVMASD